MISSFTTVLFPLTLLFVFFTQVFPTGTGYNPVPKHDPYPSGSPQPLPKCSGNVNLECVSATNCQHSSRTIVTTNSCDHLVSGACGLHTFCCASCA